MRTSAEIEADVEASRSDLDRNVEALKQKMTPGQLFDETVRMLGGAGQQVAAKFADQAKANPMPLAVMGLGLAWLMMSNNKSQAGSAAYGRAGYEPRSFAASYDPVTAYVPEASGEGASHGLKDKARQLGEKAQDMVADVQEKVAGARDTLADTGRSAGHRLSAGLDSARQGASDAGRRAQQTFIDMLQAEPLLIAGAGLLVGLAVGAALPATEAEDRVFGETRDKLVEKGKAMAHEGLEKVSAATEATYGAVKSELQSGDAERDPADRLADAARSGAQAAQEQLRNPPH